MASKKKLDKDNLIRVIKCAPQKEAEVTYIRNNLEGLQEAVEGYIEFVYPFHDSRIAVLCNEEGKLEHLDISRPILDDDDAIVDLIAGTCYIIGMTAHGDTRGLTDVEIMHYTKMWQHPIRVYRMVIGDMDILEIEAYDGKTGRKTRGYGR